MAINEVRLAVLGAALAVTSGADVVAKPAVHRSTAASGACTRLYTDMEHLKKSLAMNFADGIGDRSAARATLRENQYQSLLTRVRLTMDLMRDNRCRLPASVPTGEEYVGSALTCASDRISAGGTDTPPSCDQSKWTPQSRK